MTESLDEMLAGLRQHIASGGGAVTLEVKQDEGRPFVEIRSVNICRHDIESMGKGLLRQAADERRHCPCGEDHSDQVRRIEAAIASLEQPVGTLQ